MNDPKAAPKYESIGLLTGCFVTLLLLLNTLVLFGPLMVFALLKLVAPGRRGALDYGSCRKDDDFNNGIPKSTLTSFVILRVKT